MLEYPSYQKTDILPGRKKGLIFNLQSNKTQSGKQIKYQENSERHMAQVSQNWPMQSYYSLVCLAKATGKESGKLFNGIISYL